MRIVIDIQGVQTESRHRGIGRYSSALLEAMLRQPRNHEFWLVSNASLDAPGLGSLMDLLPAERMVEFSSVQPSHWQDPSNAWRRAASEQLRSSFLQTIQPDVVHVSSLIEGSNDAAVTSISAGAGFTSATLYDLIPLHDRSYLSSESVASWYEAKMASLQRADLLLAISEYVRRDVTDMLGFPAERVVNISSAASEIFRPIAITSDVHHRLMREYGIAGDYLLYSGAMDSRKNLERLLAAYALLPEATRAKHQLVISGKMTAIERDRIVLVARRLRLAEDRLVFTGHVSDDALVELYCAAALFVLPSLQEGFGLPALEAMACGTAVIGSCLTSIPEVIGRKDALFDPTQPSEIASAIYRVLAEPAFRQDLCAYGLRRTREFSWASCASRALDAFEEHAPPSRRQLGWSAALQRIADTRSTLIAALAGAHLPGKKIEDQDLVAAAAAIDCNEELARRVSRREESFPVLPTWRIEGPFDSSYSLALVNRELAKAMHHLGIEVGLHSTDGAGNLVPDPGLLAADPLIAQLHAASSRLLPRASDVTSRLLYPPRVADMESRFNYLHAYAWEESEIPKPWVADFNEFLQGISALSSHVAKLLVDNGVGLPITVCGAGVDHWDRLPEGEDIELRARTFRFLHVSSCLPRKGVDVLLKAYGDAFTDADDVSLIIKTFPNPQQDIGRQVQEARSARPGFPHVLVIERDLEGAQLKRLYEKCHVMVAPSRAEGFGLPMAEAMLSGLAVITTAWGGQSDFCTKETAWLIDYEFFPADTLFGLPHSVWAEPSRPHLATLLKELWQMPAEARARRTARGQDLLRRSFRWEDVARRMLRFAQAVYDRPMASCRPVLAWIGSLRTDRSGAEQAASCIGCLPGRLTVLMEEGGDTVTVPAMSRTCWAAHSNDSANILADEVARANAGTVIIHYQDDLLPPAQLELLLSRLSEQQRGIILVFENPAVLDSWPVELLARLHVCERILVPDVHGLNVLRRHSLVQQGLILGSNDVSVDGGQRLGNLLFALSWLRTGRKPLAHAASTNCSSPSGALWHLNDVGLCAVSGSDASLGKAS
ncbi:glycosyltransferase [Pseudoxanthomonas sp. JBR18]|uniref:glycosyltransferase n=1 Tax=Pseudoxanthomonas sp. JBR18 TaxID=2969308 RepID=UPI002306BA99|nr:glycosyltransferase [Pseudoxanthomonas sp. JBR18]WCE05197.1 glycosyltransferase [Pseudoxanthomonas sp. JBR18]